MKQLYYKWFIMTDILCRLDMYSLTAVSKVIFIGGGAYLKIFNDKTYIAYL